MRLGWVWASRLTATFGFFSVGCGEPPEPQRPQIACTEPSGEPATQVSVPGSRLGLTLNITEKRLSEELSKRVPKVLAKESRREVGAPGKVSYTIERGGFRFVAQGESLSVLTDLKGEIDVCKPLGPVCLRYGDCSPTWNAQVTLPLEWREPAKAKTSVALDRGCVLKPVGYNATPHIEEITAREARKVDARIDTELAEAQRQLLKGLQQGLRSVKVPGGQADKAEPLCLSWLPESLSYSLKSSESQMTEPGKQVPSLKLGLEAAGTLGLSCEGSPPLPAPELSPDLEPMIDVNVPIELTFREIERQLAAKAKAAVTLRAFQSSGQDKRANTLYVGLDGYDACGTLWLLAQPHLMEAGITLKTPGTGRAAEWLNSQIIAFPEEKTRLESALVTLQNRLETQFKRLQSDYDVYAQFNTQLQHSVQTNSTGLLLLLSTRGQAVAVAR